MDADLRIGAVFVAFSASEGSRSVNTAVLSRRNRADLEDKKCWQLQLYSFLDSERYASLESLLLQAALGHLYVAESVPPAELKKLEEVFAEVEVSHETCSKSAFNDSEVMANLQKLTGDSIMVDLSQVRVEGQAKELAPNVRGCATAAVPSCSPLHHTLHCPLLLVSFPPCPHAVHKRPQGRSLPLEEGGHPQEGSRRRSSCCRRSRHGPG